MLSRFRKEAVPLELYGKLPLAKDYLRVGGGNGAGIALRDWLDHGFSTMAERSEVPTLAWPGRFLLGGYSGDPLMGCSWPSSDSGGLRPFPFTAFLARRRKALAGEWAAGAEALRPLWDRLVGAYTAHRSYGDGQSFLAAMRGQVLEIEDRVVPPPQRIDLDVWVESLWPEDGEDGLVRVLTELGRLAADRYSGPVRLPLISNLPCVVQTHAWWFALCALGLIPQGDVPTIFFPQRGPEVHHIPAFATFFRSPLQPSRTEWVAPPGSFIGPGDYAPREVRTASGGTATSEATPPLHESLRGPLLSARGRRG